MMQCEKPQAYVVSATSDAIVKTIKHLRNLGKGGSKTIFLDAVFGNKSTVRL